MQQQIIVPAVLTAAAVVGVVVAAFFLDASYNAAGNWFKRRNLRRAAVKRNAKRAERYAVVDVPALVHLPDGQPELGWAGLSYTTEHPFDVHVYVVNGAGTTTWRVSRQLLAGGLTAPSGETYDWGTVNIRPTSTVCGGGWFDLSVAVGAEQGTLSLPVRQVRELLGQTYRLVPAGLERRSLRDKAPAEYVSIDEILDER